MVCFQFYQKLDLWTHVALQMADQVCTTNSEGTGAIAKHVDTTGPLSVSDP